MNNEYQIFDTPMPEDRNFHWLKAKGIEYVQQISGTQWTHFNESDPGVTILDQLCYALTELGYCNNFSIEDILCQIDGNIKFEDQFYLPDQILTCSPITLDDYRKLILDNEPLLKNVYIELDETEATDPDEDTRKLLSGRYKVYLYVDSQASPEDKAALPQRVYGLLNQNRNLSESFFKPLVLTAKKITLHGSIKLLDKAKPDEARSRIQMDMDQYISPPIKQYGYQDLLALGLDSDEIFNGPRLKNGWIPASELAFAKVTRVSLNKLAGIIAAIQDVKSVGDLKLQVGDMAHDEIEIETDEIGQIEIALNIENQASEGNMNLSQQLNLDLLKLQRSHQTANVGASVNLTPDLPKGKFRHISDYYSVQNTFPLIYGIGEESLTVDSPNYRVAQSRQLKGYLMVFDQLLANQFSQLANVSQLFSFKGASTTAPDQGEAYDGIPYQLFSPTYFCQPLYQIPDVKPLLLGHDTYRFNVKSINSPEEEEKVWRRYQADPFNQYIQGLRQNMENDAARDDRRNRMLDHLLARHGEPAALIDEIISTARWYGSTLKTRIIIKSIWLQNLSSLSYYRTKAYDLLQAEKLKLPGDMTEAQPNDYQLLRDGQLDLQKLYRLEQLKPQDFNNFATVELKLNLLLGLRQHYQFIAGILYSLIDCESFKNWLEDPKDPFTLSINDAAIEVKRLPDADQILFSNQCLLTIKAAESQAPNLELYQAHLAQIRWLAAQRKGFLLIETALLVHQDELLENKLEMLNLTVDQFYFRTLLIFPDYVNLFGQPDFKQNLNKLIEVYWPIHLTNHIIASSFSELKEVISAFVFWRNDLLKQSSALASQADTDAKPEPSTPIETLAHFRLMKLLNSLQDRP